MLTIAIPAGLLIGLSLGALGGGGSVLTVPILVYLLHQPPHAATAGSLLIVGITATGRPAHARRREPASPGQGGGAGRPRCFLIPGRAVTATLDRLASAVQTPSPPGSMRPGSPPRSPSSSSPWPPTRSPAACPGWCDRTAGTGNAGRR